MNALQVSHSQIMIGRDILLERLEESGLPERVAQVCLDLVEGLPAVVSASLVVAGLELLPGLVPAMTPRLWAQACLELCPEVYSEPPAGKKKSTSIPGSGPALWRLAERARMGLALWHFRDTHGLQSAAPVRMFDCLSRGVAWKRTSRPKRPRRRRPAMTGKSV